MPEKRDQGLYLGDIIESVGAIETFIEGMSLKTFVNDRKTFSATIRELEIIGEAVNKLSETLKQKYPDVLWNEIKSFRNKGSRKNRFTFIAFRYG